MSFYKMCSLEKSPFKAPDLKSTSLVQPESLLNKGCWIWQAMLLRLENPKDRASGVGPAQYIPFGDSLHFRIPGLLGVLWLTGTKLGNSGMWTRAVGTNMLLEKDGMGTNEPSSIVLSLSTMSYVQGKHRSAFGPHSSSKLKLKTPWATLVGRAGLCQCRFPY